MKPDAARGLVLEGREASALQPGMGIFVRDAVNQRVIETACIHLEMRFENVSDAVFDAARLVAFEVILADEAVARKIHEVLKNNEVRERFNPALIAVRGPDVEGLARPGLDEDFDAVLILPLEPAQVVAQLSVILYAHRAFARRYHSALEELQLNRRIFRSVTNGISVANAEMPDMPLVYVNPAFEVMTGFSLEEVLGKNCRFLQGDDREQPGVMAIREALQQEREVVAVLKNYRKNGAPFWNELSLSPIRNRDGVLTHFVGIQTDVSARMEFEAALRESEKLAAVGRLASSIAHEINNPLEAVMNLLYLARHSEVEAETQSYLATAEKELQRVSLITSQSLRFYKQSTKPQAVHCGDLLESVLDLYAARLENARIVVERTERPMGTVICLESEIRQVLNNLVRNALDAMLGKGGRLRVRSREATDWPSGARGALMTVADTGSGISRETMKQIYKAFFTTKGIGGTGLGLWISSEIVERHRGRLRVRSRQGERSGTVFQLFIPFEPVAVEQANAA